MKKKSVWARRIICFGAICLALFLLYALGLGCRIKYFFHIPCPTCGVSRAMTALLKFDFKAYAEYNAMALPLVLSVGAALHLKLLPRRRLFEIVIFAVLILNAVYYMVRLCNGELDFL